MNDKNKQTKVYLKNGYRYIGYVLPCEVEGFLKMESKGEILTINLDSIERIHKVVQ